MYGYVTSGVTELAIASTTGLAATQTMTDATVLALAGDAETSGYADATAWRIGDLDPAAVARQAAETAARTRDPVGIEPGTHRAVLSPWAFAELLSYFNFSSLGALALLEGRSYFSGRIGEQVFDERLTIHDVASDPAGMPKAFDFEGVPKQPVTIVEAGVARNVVWDRRTAAREDRESTGHALPVPAQTHGPVAFNLFVDPGTSTLDELAELVGDGIYVTRLHYVNTVDARESIYTGMTRDGTFLIEGGRVTRPLVNLRFTTSFGALCAGTPRALERADARERERLLRRAVSARVARPGRRHRGVHDRGNRLAARALALLEGFEQHERVDREDDRDDHGQAREVPLDDVLSALRGRRVAHSPEARVAARVHEHEHDQDDREDDLKGCEKADHGCERIASSRAR